ncbi:phage portal protein [Bradyrhizobium sp.]|uniref:phage portal protein n=1 Tax=Bradyrhizobium sp. TaxID=376 RepID=UPI003C40111E
MGEYSPLLYQPNDWEDYFEFAEMMQFSLVMRGNAYAVRIKNGRGVTIRLVPVNVDWVALWESPDGGLFYRVTPNGLKMRAELAGQPFLVPAADIIHVKGFSMNGLLGASRIVLAKEAIALSLGYERQAAQYMSQGANTSGILTTEQRLSPEAAARMAADWKTQKSGLQNAGKILVLEQGLKYQPTTLSASDAEFIQARNLQIQEITRIFRIPAHMLGDLARSTNNNISQMAQEYINLTMSSYTQRWRWALDVAFGLRKQTHRSSPTFS